MADANTFFDNLITPVYPSVNRNGLWGTRAMKGIIFTELFDLVEQAFGYEISERLLDECDLPSGGVYTSVGTYDHTEILELVGHLSKLTDIPAPQLLITYGKYIFSKLHAQLDTMGLTFDNSFSLFSALDDIIHPEVLKLYPDAELPTFSAQRLNDDQLKLVYRSCRPFAHMAEGLILGCGDHYGEGLTVDLSHLNDNNDPRTDITITRQ